MTIELHVGVRANCFHPFDCCSSRQLSVPVQEPSGLRCQLWSKSSGDDGKLTSLFASDASKIQTLPLLPYSLRSSKVHSLPFFWQLMQTLGSDPETMMHFAFFWWHIVQDFLYFVLSLGRFAGGVMVVELEKRVLVVHHRPEGLAV